MYGFRKFAIGGVDGFVFFSSLCSPVLPFPFDLITGAKIAGHLVEHRAFQKSKFIFINRFRYLSCLPISLP
jgi:hypothetical protein